MLAIKRLAGVAPEVDLGECNYLREVGSSFWVGHRLSVTISNVPVLVLMNTFVNKTHTLWSQINLPSHLDLQVSPLSPVIRNLLKNSTDP